METMNKTALKQVSSFFRQGKKKKKGNQSFIVFFYKTAVSQGL